MPDYWRMAKPPGRSRGRSGWARAASGARSRPPSGERYGGTSPGNELRGRPRCARGRPRTRSRARRPTECADRADHVAPQRREIERHGRGGGRGKRGAPGPRRALLGVRGDRLSSPIRNYDDVCWRACTYALGSKTAQARQPFGRRRVKAEGKTGPALPASSAALLQQSD